MNYIERLASALEHGIERGVALAEDLIWECHKLVKSIEPVIKKDTAKDTQCTTPVSPAVVDSLSVTLDATSWLTPHVPPTRGEPRHSVPNGDNIVAEPKFASHHPSERATNADPVSVGDKIDVPLQTIQTVREVPPQKRPEGGSKKDEGSDAPVRKRTTGKGKNRGRKSNTGPVIISLKQLKFVGSEYVPE